jgi:hypothetical protein
MTYYIPFSIVLFLIILNGYLRGKWKQYVDIVLGVVIFAIVVFAIYSEGLATLIYLGLIWLIGGNLILMPLAKITARKLLS